MSAGPRSGTNPPPSAAITLPSAADVAIVIAPGVFGSAILKKASWPPGLSPTVMARPSSIIDCRNVVSSTPRSLSNSTSVAGAMRPLPLSAKGSPARPNHCSRNQPPPESGPESSTSATGAAPDDTICSSGTQLLQAHRRIVGIEAGRLEDLAVVVEDRVRHVERHGPLDALVLVRRRVSVERTPTCRNHSTAGTPRPAPSFPSRRSTATSTR